MQNPLKNRHVYLCLRLLPFFLLLLIAAVFLLSGDTVTSVSILSLTPKNYLLAFLFLLVLYAAKSMSVFFPIIVLYIACGSLFPPVLSLFINTLGTAVCLTLPYWIGYFSGIEVVEKLISRHPNIREIIEKQQNNDWFLCYFLRIISCLPGDIVSMYLGSLKIPFHKYLIGSMIGVFPGIVLATYIGISITDPTSPVFITSVVLRILLSVGSVVIYRFSKERKQRK